MYKQRECYILNLKTETHAIDFFDILYDFINISLQRYLLELMLFVHVKKKILVWKQEFFFYEQLTFVGDGISFTQ